MDLYGGAKQYRIFTFLNPAYYKSDSMGLDIYHVKATLQRPRTKDPFGLTSVQEIEFEGFNVPFAHFSRYIQQIDTPEILQTCILVRNEQYLEEATEWFKHQTGYKIFFERDKRSLAGTINHFATQHNLNSLIRYVGEGCDKWHVLKYYELVKKTGFYTTNEGYQRKGVNAHFAERFYHDTLYRFALHEDFEYAYNCIDYYWDSDTAEDVLVRKKEFKETFIDTFAAGASYLHVSY